VHRPPGKFVARCQAGNPKRLSQKSSAASHSPTAHRRQITMRLFVLLFPALCCFLFCAPGALAQLSTDDHLAEPGFWPRQSAASRSDFAGAQACASCHAGIAATQKATPMANAALYTSESGILHEHPKLNFAFSHYKYELQTDAQQTIYSLSDGEQTLKYPLSWAFGVGRVGQSFLFKKEDGKFYEARVTYFAPLQTLNFTPGRAITSAKSAEEAMYRAIGAAEVTRCFTCHTTASNIGEEFDEKHLIPGVSCEACHSPGAKHVSAMQTAKLTGIAMETNSTIFNSAVLKPADSVDFCGACHGTFWDVKLGGITGPSTARSQPFRLEQSKCWGTGDARLTCIACHDPHKQLETDTAAYDGACLRCHVNATSAKKTADHPGPACPVSTQNCASCHMPKVYVPEMHDNFTDHRIRIAHPGEAYPE